MDEQIINEIRSVVTKLYGVDVSVVLDRPEESFGDYATNVAMQLAKPLQKNPREIAQDIASELKEVEFIRSAGVAGPGFININLDDQYLLDSLSREASKPYAGLKFVVEYSDPNPFKPLHAGHLYTTLVGDSISRIVSRAGAEVTRLNYGGDVGMHVGKTMWAIERKLAGKSVEELGFTDVDDTAAWLGKCYVEGTDAYETDQAAKEEIIAINKRVYDIHSSQDQESDLAVKYWKLRGDSYENFKKFYNELQVISFDRFIPESEVAPIGLKILEEQLENNVYQRSEGAVIFDGESHGLHSRVFLNSEGLPTYETKELGLMFTKWNDYNFDRSIIITGSEQQQYMEVVLKSIEQYEPNIPERTTHITHGLVKLTGGVKMSSRKGNILSAYDILQSAREAGQEEGGNVDEVVMLAAVKYSFLKSRIGGDVIYDPTESIATEGNSGPYLQYAHARARSILAKASATPQVVGDLDSSERSLLLKLSEYSEVVNKAALELAPHVICTYLFELSQVFNRFYENSKVIGDPRESTRLVLIENYAETLKDGLELLGITAPDRM